MKLRFTMMRIIKEGEVIANFDTRNEPSIYNDIITALNTDLQYAGYGDRDVIITAQFYLYDNIKHWVIELVEDEDMPI